MTRQVSAISYWLLAEEGREPLAQPSEQSDSAEAGATAFRGERQPQAVMACGNRENQAAKFAGRFFAGRSGFLRGSHT